MTKTTLYRVTALLLAAAVSAANFAGANALATQKYVAAERIARADGPASAPHVLAGRRAAAT